MSTPKKVGRQNTGRLSTSKSRGYVMSLYSRRDLRPCHSLCSEVILCLFSDSCDTRSCTVSETLPISVWLWTKSSQWPWIVLQFVYSMREGRLADDLSVLLGILQ